MQPFCAPSPSKLEREMRIRYSILAILCAGACAFAQQQPAAQKSNQGQQKQPQSARQQQASGQPQAESAQQKPSPAEANPFPEAASEKTADAANAAAKRSSGSSSSHVDLNRLNAPPGSAARISNGEGGYIHDPQLAAQDDKVGGFYLQTKDYKGAYDRFLEATRVAPEDGNAVFGLAEASRGLNRDEEAITNYTIYLQAFPNGKKAKDAQKALKQLSSVKK